MMIEVKKLSKMYGNNYVLKNINLKVNKAEFIFILGASGSGKSTFLKILTKEESITSGDVFVNRINIKKIRPRQIPYYRRKFGIIFQDFRLIEKMNIFDNIAFPMRIMGASNTQIKKRILNVLDLVSLNDKLYRFPCELSGGEKQRIGLARAIVNDPEIILADEPTGNVDPKMSYEILDILSKINKKGITTIVVTHDTSLISKFNFRKIRLENGFALDYNF